MNGDTTQGVQPIQKGLRAKVIWGVGVAVVVVALAGFSYWYFYMRVQKAVAPTEPLPEQEDLGSTLYENATNPVKDKVPEAIPNVVNPLEGAYQNPFE